MRDQDETWRMRLKAIHVRQNVWARLTGYTESTVSRQLTHASELPRIVKLAILAWEKLTPDERLEIAQTLDQSSSQPTVILERQQYAKDKNVPINA